MDALHHETRFVKLRLLTDVQGGSAKVKPLTFLLVTFECIGKIQ